MSHWASFPSNLCARSNASPHKLINRYSTLQMLSWQAAYFDYQTELRANLSKPALVVPVIAAARLGKASEVVTVQLPPLNFLATFGKMEIDFGLNCLGSRDADCPGGDHCITLTATCHGKTGATVATSPWGEEENGDPGARVGDNKGTVVSLGLGEAGGTTNEIGRWVTPFRRRGE